jgi:hypothetical protein
MITQVPVAKQIFIQGFSNSTPSAVGGVTTLYTAPDSTYYTINLSVVGSDVGGSTTYTVYYYGIT